MTRIRYKKISVNIYQTTKPILLGQYLAHAVINVETKTGEIYDGTTILVRVGGKDFNQIKKVIRIAFRERGAQLTDEVRKVIK